LWSPWLPWLKFILATSMPASTRARIFSGVAVAGPRVQTIFARRLTFAQRSPSPGVRLYRSRKVQENCSETVPSSWSAAGQFTGPDAVAGQHVELAQLTTGLLHPIERPSFVQDVVRLPDADRVHRAVAQQVEAGEVGVAGPRRGRKA